MTKVTAELTEKVTGSNGGNGKDKGAQAVEPIQIPAAETEMIKIPVPPAPEVKKELSVVEKILKIENLQLVIAKRQKLIETYSQLERFQIGSNEFNCSMKLSDSDGNVFVTTFTPGIKKVIDFLKTSFEKSIEETEQQIKF